MNTKHSIAAGILALVLGWLPGAKASAAEDIPTTLTGPVDSAEYPDPICTTCVVRTVKRSAGSAAQAFVEVEYLDAVPFEGEIAVTVWLASGHIDTLVIPGVLLEHGDLEWYEVTANAGWTWNDVQKVSLELVAPR